MNDLTLIAELEPVAKILIRITNGSQKTPTLATQVATLTKQFVVRCI